MEIEQLRDGPLLRRRMALFNNILGAMRDAHDQLAQDGVDQAIIDQIIANTIAHVLAFAAVNLNLSQPDLAESFLGYCKLVEAEQSNTGAHKLDS